MDLHTGTLLWSDTSKDIITYPTIASDQSCDVLIIGGGEAGAMAAHFLTTNHVDCILIEKRRIGYGSSRGNTGLLQFANDAPLWQLVDSIGTEAAVRYYKLCQRAVDMLDAVTDALPDKGEFIRRDSLYYASTANDVKKLEWELELHQRFGFPTELLTKEQIRERFSFEKEAALYTRGDAEINPFRYCRSLIHHAHGRGMRVYEDTEAFSIHHEGDGLHFHTENGFTIKAKKAVFCTGYETQERQKTPGAVIASSYAIATEPLHAFPGWQDRCLIWETARPYLYLRTTADNRILVGGLDETVADGPKRDNPLPQKADQLLAALKQLFPALGDIRYEYAWASSFGGTKDGLPYIGEHPEHKNCYYSLGYGGNGTAYTTIAGEIIKDLILYGQHPDAALFSLGRMR